MKCDYMKYTIFENENLILKWNNIFDTDEAPYFAGYCLREYLMLVYQYFFYGFAILTGK